MAQSQTALGTNRARQSRCERTGYDPCRFSPHPGPLPKGQGEAGTDQWTYPRRIEFPRASARCSLSPRERARVRGTAATATLRLRTPHGTVELFESPGRAGNLRELIMKASARLRMVLFAEFAMAALAGANANAEWWQHPHDKWYLKDDWKAAEVDRYGPTFTLQSPAAGGWVVVWGNNGVMLSAKGAGVMKEVD